ncbi:MAG TPA: hypothetical protein VF475_11025 [Sphingobium sp.]
MTPPQRQQDSDSSVAKTPARPSQQRTADKTAAAKIDATEFWRRLGL